MRQYISISILLLFSTICYSNNEKTEPFINIISKVPKLMMISEIPYLGLEHPHVISDPNDPNQAIRKREIDYTMIWLWKTINRDLIREINQEEFQLLSGLGNKKDDALMISWNKDQFVITVIDGRFLALSVRVKNEFQANVEAVFRKVVNYWHYANTNSVKISLETLSATDSNDTWGRIIVDQGRATDWYEKPVEWYKAGNEVIFAFDKIVKQPVSKVPLNDKASLYFGGIPIDDNRSYLRFKNSNREELSKEYFQKRKPPKLENNRG